MTLIAPRAEMGQGVMTTLAALLAEELDVALDAVRVLHGPASAAYLNAAVLADGLPFAPTDDGWIATGARRFMDVPARFIGMQITGGSSSIPDAWHKMRLAGAAARSVLVQAAAQRWSMPASALRTEAGTVIAGDGRRLAYPELALAAAAIEPPSRPRVKRPSEWRLLGRSLPRLDMLSKCTGTAEYSIDVRLPGMLYATVHQNPHRSGGLRRLDANAATRMRGVVRVLEVPGAVAVVATNTWYAFEAAQALRIEWDPPTHPRSLDEHFAAVDAAFAGRHDSRFRDDGDVTAALAQGSAISAEYRVPYLAHATLEPMNAVAWLTDEGLQVWVGTQIPTQVVVEAARITGLAPDRIRVHTTIMGGGFGRRAEMDFVIQAIQVAQALTGTPIKLTWSRAQDTRHDAYRPLAIGRMRASVRNGEPLALDLSLAAPSVVDSQFARLGIAMPGPDFTIAQAAWDQPYRLQNYRVTAWRAPPLLPVGWWRSVGASQNGFFHESAIDEIAHLAGLDPLTMRERLIDHPPSRAVLAAVREMSGWGRQLPDGHAHGVAFVLSFGVPTAEVVEIAVSDAGIRIVEVWAAVDVGIALDPRNIEAQVQSGVLFGLSAAVSGAIDVVDGAVVQSNFHDYPLMRLHQSPAIHVRVLASGGAIRGIGEPGTPPAAPALANAIFAATGERLRSLPLGRSVTFV